MIEEKTKQNEWSKENRLRKGRSKEMKKVKKEKIKWEINVKSSKTNFKLRDQNKFYI